MARSVFSAWNRYSYPDFLALLRTAESGSCPVCAILRRVDAPMPASSAIFVVFNHARVWIFCCSRMTFNSRVIESSDWSTHDEVLGACTTHKEEFIGTPTNLFFETCGSVVLAEGWWPFQRPMESRLHLRIAPKNVNADYQDLLESSWQPWKRHLPVRRLFISYRAQLSWITRKWLIFVKWF